MKNEWNPDGCSDAFDDRQMAELAAYIRAGYAPGQPAWRNLAEALARSRQEAAHGSAVAKRAAAGPIGQNDLLATDGPEMGHESVEILPHFHHRLTIRNNVFTERGMISGDRAGILSPMLLNARRYACAFPPCPLQFPFEPCDG
ncbi:hypothetical protein [Burkholderia sp. LMG 32019]|uniref:hypothetical protein n=1 Tax=Burkholderia sp. LMG 32019 TaxID=3158173 RepID=UPI003C2FF5F3